jgi:hypothetical protein
MVTEDRERPPLLRKLVWTPLAGELFRELREPTSGPGRCRGGYIAAIEGDGEIRPFPRPVL